MRTIRALTPSATHIIYTDDVFPARSYYFCLAIAFNPQQRAKKPGFGTMEEAMDAAVITEAFTATFAGVVAPRLSDIAAELANNLPKALRIALVEHISGQPMSELAEASDYDWIYGYLLESAGAKVYRDDAGEVVTWEI